MTTANEIVEILRRVTYKEGLNTHQRSQLKRLFAENLNDAREEWELWSQHFILLVGSFDILKKQRNFKRVVKETTQQ